MTNAPPEPRPSATVVLLRDGAAGLELLLLQRAPRDAKPGPWVFPGGKVERRRRRGGRARLARERAARRRARDRRRRPASSLEHGRLVAISRWITPEIAPQRFDTWFFVGAVDASHEVVVCGSEMVAHRWLDPAAALARTTQRRAPARAADLRHRELADRARARRRRRARARPTRRSSPSARTSTASAEGAVMLYPGDAGYESDDPSLPGARHRILALADAAGATSAAEPEALSP